MTLDRRAEKFSPQDGRFYRLPRHSSSTSLNGKSIPTTVEELVVDRTAAWQIAGAGMISLALAMGLGRFAQTPILPFMIEELSWSKAQAGLIASANFLGYFVGCLWLGFVTFAINRRRLLLAVSASVATTLAMGATTDMATLAALRFAGGVTSAAVLIVSTTWILSQLETRGRADLGGLLFAGVGLGIALSAVLAEFFADWGWRGLWLVCGLMAFVGLFAIMRWSSSDQTVDVRSAGRGLPELGRLRVLLVAYGLVGFGYVITATFISTIIRETPPLAHLETTAWLVVGLTGAPSIWFWNRIARWSHLRLAFALACWVEALGVVLAVSSHNPIAILLAAGMLGGTFMGLTAMGLARARLILPDSPQAAIALMSAAFAFGQMVGPAFAGMIGDITGSLFWPSMVAAAALCLSSVLAMAPDQG